MEDSGRTYAQFIEAKAHSFDLHGFEPIEVPDFLFPFQRDLVTWSLRKGRSAIFADCGLGKTPCQLVWADNVVRHTNRHVLVLTPLAVSAQTIQEANKFGIQAQRSADGSVPESAAVVVANYERLHLFDPSDFAGVVLDESSILKNFDGKRRKSITEFMRKMSYRLACTATAAPNDYIELGTTSEALGELGHMDMLARFFKNDQHTSNMRTMNVAGKERAKWRFRGHAEQPFWRWVCSWARAVRRPSDLGYDDEGFALPDLTEHEHIVEARTLRDGELFALPAQNLQEEREERRRTINERCEKVADLVDHGKQALVWCHLNDEGKLIRTLIPDAVEVKGSDAEEEKEAALMGFQRGDIRVLVTKPKIGAWGLNFQSCAHTTFFPSHSYEQYYQGVRRLWRFGQKLPVTVDVIATEGERGVMSNLQRKAAQADRMFSSLVQHMNEAVSLRRTEDYTGKVEVPAWL